MKNIIFVCHGNICRSPCAEVIAKKLIKKNKLKKEINVFSRALSYEEFGNDIFPPMKKVLDAHKLKYETHKADVLKEEEVIVADEIYYMDANNYKIIKFKYRRYLSKFHLISEFTDNLEIEDPWYTNRFEYVYTKIEKAVTSILNNYLVSEKQEENQ